MKRGADYCRNRLASLAMLRGTRFCGLTPFAVSAEASWQHMRDEYMYPGGTPCAIGAGWTGAASAPNPGAYTKMHVWRKGRGALIFCD